MDTEISLDCFTIEELEHELELRRKLTELTDNQLIAELQRRMTSNIFVLTGKRYGELKINDDGKITDIDDFQGTMILLYNT